MKLAAKLTISLSAFALLLFGATGIWQLRAEEEELRRTAQRESLLLARSLQVAFENALRDRQIEDVDETLVTLSSVDPSVAIFVFDEDGILVGASHGARPSASTQKASERARGAHGPLVEFTEDKSPNILRVALRLRDEVPERPSSIVLERPLTTLEEDLQETRLSILLAVAGFIACVAALTWLLARRYVGRPLGTLVGDMKRVRSGNLQIGVHTGSHDEVGEVQREFQRLVKDLELAQARGDQEFEARQNLERHLQNADKLITLGQLSAVMAHEIGSPLQVLEGRARAMKKHADDPHATRRTADILVEQTERITRIVGQLLSLTRRKAPVRKWLDANEPLQGVVALLEVEARNKNIQISTSQILPTDVFADADQLQQVFLNLIRNALESAPAGSTVSVTMHGEPSSLAFDIHDQGPGISEGVRERLFEPFFTTKAASGGHGLGLSVVKSIVQEHGGSVAFLDGIPRGCTVRVQIPRQWEGTQ
jgi:signal transduction histidine kinase